MNRIFIIIIFLLLTPILSFSLGNTENTESTNNTAGVIIPGTNEFPVKAVSIFTNGLAYITHEGIIQGNHELELSIPNTQIDDFLKTMVVQDFDGGLVETISYESNDPLDRTLENLRIDLSSNPSIRDLLLRSIGEEIIVEAQGRIQGKIISSTQDRNIEGETVYIVNILSGSSIIPVEISSIEEMEFTDPAIQAAFQTAVEVTKTRRNTRNRTIRVRFNGDGERRIRLSYLQTAPLWKTTYRLVLNQQTDLSDNQLQAWAIVENTSDFDWTGISLSLVSGNPQNFLMDISSPIYTSRPRLQTPRGTNITTRAYEQARREDYIVERSFSEAPSSSADMRSGLMLEMAEEATGRIYSDEADDFEQSISNLQTNTSIQQLGNFFQFDISIPVTIPRRSSAMVPIVDQVIGGSPVLLYDPSVLSQNALFAYYLENNSGSSLPAGPISVFTSGQFGGESLINEIAESEKRLLSYSIAANVRIQKELGLVNSQFIAVEITDGLMYLRSEQKRTISYSVDNGNNNEEYIVVLHPKNSGWDLDAGNNAVREATNIYEIDFPVSPGSSQVYEVIESRINLESFSMRSLSEARLEQYISTEELPEEVKDLLKAVLELKRRINLARNELNSLDRSINEIYRSQERLRENMAVINEESSLYQRYLGQLNQQEDELMALSSQKVITTDNKEDLELELEELVSSYVFK